jgi:hypothetical protein
VAVSDRTGIAREGLAVAIATAPATSAPRAPSASRGSALRGASGPKFSPFAKGSAAPARALSEAEIAKLKEIAAKAAPTAIESRFAATMVTPLPTPAEAERKRIGIRIRIIIGISISIRVAPIGVTIAVIAPAVIAMTVIAATVIVDLGYLV